MDFKSRNGVYRELRVGSAEAPAIAITV